MSIYTLGKIPTEIIYKVGGKARGLNFLINNGYDVPTGFIIYEPNGEYKEAVETYNKFGMKKVACRSSTTLEDGDDFSSAGQFSTFLNIEGEEGLVKGINECVSSLI